MDPQIPQSLPASKRCNQWPTDGQVGDTCPRCGLSATQLHLWLRDDAGSGYVVPRVHSCTTRLQHGLVLLALDSNDLDGHESCSIGIFRFPCCCYMMLPHRVVPQPSSNSNSAKIPPDRHDPPPECAMWRPRLGHFSPALLASCESPV